MREFLELLGLFALFLVMNGILIGGLTWLAIKLGFIRIDKW